MKLPDFISQPFTPFFQSPQSPTPPIDLDTFNEALKSKEAFEAWLDNNLKGCEHAVEPSNALQPTQPNAPSTNAVASSSGPSETGHAPPMANTLMYSASPVAPLADITDPFLQFNAAQPSASSSNHGTIPFPQANAYQQPYLGTGNTPQLDTQWNNMGFGVGGGIAMSQNAHQSTYGDITNTMNTEAFNFYLPAFQTGNGNGLGDFPTTHPLAPSSSRASEWGLQSGPTQRFAMSQEQQRQWMMLQKQQQRRMMLQHQQQYANFQWQRQQGNAGSVQNMYQGQGQDALGFAWGMNANMGPQPNSYPSSSTQMSRPPQHDMGPYPNIVPAPQYNVVPSSVPSISRLARQPSHPQFLQQAQPVATRPATMLGNRATVDRSAQLAQGSNPGTGEAAMTPGTALLQRVFAPSSGGPVAPTRQAQVQSAPELKIIFMEGKKRARKDEDRGEEDEERPKKKAVKARKEPSTAKKAMPRVIALRRSSQVSPEQQGEVGAGPVPQQHAEDKSRVSTPVPNSKITGASEAAMAPPEKISLSTPFIPKPDLDDPAFAELFAKPVTLASLSVVIPPLVACHWGYDGTKPPCGHVCKDRTEWYRHMWQAHEADLVGDEAQVDCLWPGCTRWERSKGAGSLSKSHMNKGFHSWVLTRFLRLRCRQCQEFVGETLEDWSTRSKNNHELKPYVDHAEECPKRVDEKEHFLWDVCPLD